MMLRVYSVFDRKALSYANPFYAVNDASAVRIVSDAAGDDQTSLSRHPNDYVVYCIGEYNTDKGELVPYSPLVHLVDVIALIKAPAPVLPFPKTESA